jgi:hypothetical protein
VVWDLVVRSAATGWTEDLCREIGGVASRVVLRVESQVRRARSDQTSRYTHPERDGDEQVNHHEQPTLCNTGEWFSNDMLGNRKSAILTHPVASSV